MARNRYSSQEIIGKSRPAEDWLAKGVWFVEAVRQLGVKRVTYYRWRKEYRGLGVVRPAVRKSSKRRIPG